MESCTLSWWSCDPWCLLPSSCHCLGPGSLLSLSVTVMPVTEVTCAASHLTLGFRVCRQLSQLRSFSLCVISRCSAAGLAWEPFLLLALHLELVHNSVTVPPLSLGLTVAAGPSQDHLFASSFRDTEELNKEITHFFLKHEPLLPCSILECLRRDEPRSVYSCSTVQVLLEHCAVCLSSTCLASVT